MLDLLQKNWQFRIRPNFAKIAAFILVLFLYVRVVNIEL